MTPKEKANHLVNMFSDVGLQQRNEGISCAIIAVEEIIIAIDWHEYETPNDWFNYWQQVKQEIENL